MDGHKKLVNLLLKMVSMVSRFREVSEMKLFSQIGE